MAVTANGHVLFADGSGTVLANASLADRAGRLVITDLVVKAERVTGRALALIPLGRIEEIVNRAELAEGVRRSIETDGSDDDAGRTLADLQRSGEMSAGASRPRRSRRPGPLIVPAGRSYPDEFYERVAEAYAAHAALGSRPAMAMAELNEVPASTVHRWVKEARRRGVMAPSSRHTQLTDGGESA